MRGADIKRRLRESGRSQVALGKFLGVTKDSVGRLVNETRKIEADERDRITAFFAGEPSEPSPAFVRLDVYGYAAAGGDDRVAIAEDRVVDRIEVPVGMVRGDAFAIRVAGDSMEPRLYSGEIVIVARNMAPTRNGDCVVETKDGSAVVKQYRGQRDGVVFLHQYNPDKEVRIKADDVRAVHAVLYRR